MGAIKIPAGMTGEALQELINQWASNNAAPAVKNTKKAPAAPAPFVWESSPVEYSIEKEGKEKFYVGTYEDRETGETKEYRIKSNYSFDKKLAEDLHEGAHGNLVVLNNYTEKTSVLLGDTKPLKGLLKPLKAEGVRFINAIIGGRRFPAYTFKTSKLDTLKELNDLIVHNIDNMIH